MIIILKREDLPRAVRGKPADKLDLFDTGLDTVHANSAELIVFMENEEIRVLKAARWSKGTEYDWHPEGEEKSKSFPLEGWEDRNQE